MTTSSLIGVWPDVLVPLTPELNIDLPKFASHVRNLEAKGIQRFTLFGYAGEGASFSTDEKLAALAHLIQAGLEPNAILLGVSSSALTDAARLIEQAHAQGVRRFLVAPPTFYQPVTNRAVIDYFDQLIAKVHSQDWQLYLHALGGSHSEISEPVVADLLRTHPQILAGVVDQDTHESHTLDFMRSFGKQISVSPTHEPNLKTLKPTGTVSVLANFIPGVIKHLLENEMPAQTHQVAGMKVRQPDDRVIELLNLMGDQPRVAVLKLMLSMHYRQTNWEFVRPPQTRLSNEARDLMMKAFKTFNLLPTE